LLGGLDPRLDVVVTIEPVLVDHPVGDPAAITAELQVSVVFHQAGGDGEGAMVAFDRHRRDSLMGGISTQE